MGSIPIGQGVSVTALQMLAAYNAVANGGKYVAPRLVKATIDSNGGVARRRPEPVAPCLSTNRERGNRHA